MTTADRGGNVRATYGNTLVKLGDKDNRIVVVEADLMKASGSECFREVFPERHFQVGIAEQNLIGVSAGLASMGKIPFASTFACFASQRACDQAVNAVAYNRFNVKICGTYAGLTSEKNGGTHISVEDIAIYRAMPNMMVIAPGDCVELAKAMETIAEYDGPVYLRMARGPLPIIFNDDYEFEIGKAVVIQEGKDATIITTGITTWYGIQAVKILKTKGITTQHLHMPTIKPLDRKAVIKAANQTGSIVTVENHSIIGGLGSAVAELLCETCPVPVKRLGMQDKFGETATLEWLLEKHELTPGHIVKAVKQILKQKVRKTKRRGYTKMKDDAIALKGRSFYV